MSSFKSLLSILNRWLTVGTGKLRRGQTTEEWRLIFVEAGTRFLYALRQIKNATLFLSKKSATEKTPPKVGACLLLASYLNISGFFHVCI